MPKENLSLFTLDALKTFNKELFKKNLSENILKIVTRLKYFMALSRPL